MPNQWESFVLNGTTQWKHLIGPGLLVCLWFRWNLILRLTQGKLPHPALNCHRRAGRSGLRRARGTPHDMREGMIGAMALVREGLDETARSLADAATERSGMAGAVGGVLRAVPSTMVRPVILGAAATSNLLDGVKNQISPDQRLEEEDKWKTS